MASLVVVPDLVEFLDNLSVSGEEDSINVEQIPFEKMCSDGVEEAEVTVEMDNILFKAWEKGGELGLNFDSTSVKRKKIVTGNNLTFNNIKFKPNEIGTLYLKFNFLTKELTNKEEFIYHVVQRDAVTNELIGGETYEIRKKPTQIFVANAGNDLNINKNETATLVATQINEDAIYNWYDPNGDLIYIGTDLTVSPDITKKYKLEIVSNINGYKDYDEIEVKVNPYTLESLVPNPASNQVIVNHIIDGANSAYITIFNINTASSNNYILDVQETNTVIDISSYNTGLYTITLVCDGEVQDSKTLIKE